MFHVQIRSLYNQMAAREFFLDQRLEFTRITAGYKCDKDLSRQMADTLCEQARIAGLMAEVVK